jgi:subtilase family serine protease
MPPIRRITSTVTAGILAAGGLTFALTAPAQAAPGYRQADACGAAAKGYARCLAIVRTATTSSASSSAGDVSPLATTPSGLTPAKLQSAYALPSATAGSGQTVAIVDAYDDPNAEADLATYRSYFGLSACTTANGCFKKVNQTGGTSYPAKNGGWAEEISLDIDMVSAICPNCKILLVEATTASFANLGAAVNEAATLGATAISNSYGSTGDASDSTYGKYYNHPGIAVTVSSGDDGYGISYPASSHYVTAVGGTTLTAATGTTRGWTETAWSGAGSGCSTYNAALTGQAAFSTGCTKRAEADVSAVANPSTGVSVYDSYAYNGSSGWLTFGGTSVSAPIIAGVYALAGNASSIDNNYPYTHSTGLYDVTSGSNGSCSTTQWCTARAGWDGPTGLGTPNGVTAF